jgi:hypothetical protein
MRSGWALLEPLAPLGYASKAAVYGIVVERFHHEERRALMLANVVEGADVGILRPATAFASRSIRARLPASL